MDCDLWSTLSNKKISPLPPTLPLFPPPPKKKKKKETCQLANSDFYYRLEGFTSLEETDGIAYFSKAYCFTVNWKNGFPRVPFI